MKTTKTAILSIVFFALSSLSRGAAADYLYVSDFPSRSVSVIDTADNTLVATIGDIAPSGVALSPDGSRLYVLDKQEGSFGGDDELHAYDTQNFALLSATLIGTVDTDLAVSPDGSRVYVVRFAPSASIAVVDTATSTVVDSIVVGGTPRAVAVSPDGAKLFVANQSTDSIDVIDLGTATVADSIAVGANIFGTGLAFSPDGSEAYLSDNSSQSVYFIDAVSHSIAASVLIGQQPGGVAAHPDGTRIYVTRGGGQGPAVLDTATRSITKNLTFGGGVDMAFSTDSGTLYIGTGSQGVGIMNAVSDSFVGRLSAYNGQRIAVGPDPRKYTFQSLFSTPFALRQAVFGFPAINNNGVVAVGIGGGATGGVAPGNYIHDGTTPTWRATANLYAMDINDVGSIAFVEGTLSGDTHFSRLDADGTYQTLLSCFYGGAPGTCNSRINGHYSMNNLGTIAVALAMHSGPPVVARFDETAFTIIETQDNVTGPYNFSAPDINDSGVVGFKAQSPSIFAGLYSGSGGPVTLEGDLSPWVCGGSGNNASINNSGVVAGSGPCAAATAIGGNVTVVADGTTSSSPYTSLGGNQTINNLGRVLFIATERATGLTGLFTGPDPVLDKVVQHGDPLFGGVVNEIRLGANGFNDQGQATFLLSVGLPDGSTVSHVVLAMPLISNEPPVAVAGDNQAIHVGQTASLDGRGSFDDSTPTENLGYDWSFDTLPAGSTASLNGATTATPTFTADLPGDYEISLVVTDAGGLSSEPDTVLVSSLNVAPNADAGPDQAGIVGDLFQLDGSASSDPDLDALTYSWALTAVPAGSTASLANASTVSPSFVADKGGSYTAQLIVNDGYEDSDPDTTNVTVITGEQSAEIDTVSAINEVTSLPQTEVSTAGNQQALTNTLSQVVAALQAGDPAEAIQKLQKAIERTDGCALRGSPDAGGGGAKPPKKDYVTDCAAQAGIYPVLVEALAALTG